MRKPIIAIDVDDVLADNAAGFVAYSNQKWGTNLTVDDYDEHWGRVWKIEHDKEETLRRRDNVIDSRIYRDYYAIDGAYEVLKKLSKKYELHIATSRLLRMKQDTLEWLDEHYDGIFHSDTINYAGIWDNLTEKSVYATKADLVRSIGADYLIDDQIKHCQAVAEASGKALLFGDFSWNQTPSDGLNANVSRVANWSEVEEYFYEK